MKNSALILPGVAALLLGVSAGAQAQYRVIPGASSADDVTPDGKIVVGRLASGGAYYWDMENDPAPTPIGGSTAKAVSADGSVITGNIDDPLTGAQVAGRWTQATGWVPIGGLSGTCGSISSAYDISADGNQIVGLGWFGCSGRGFLWTNGQSMLELMNLGNGQNRCTTISANGDLMGGFAQGNFSRTPATWLPDTTGIAPNLDDQGEILGMNDFGTIFVGTLYDSGVWYDAFYNVGGTTFFMGSLNDGWAGNAKDVNEDLSRIVGFDSQGLGGEAWVWNINTGIESLQDKLTDAGVQNVPFLTVASACSNAGDIIVGHNTFADAWVATLPIAKTEPYGCTGSPSSLAVLSGTSAIGDTLTLGIDDPGGAASPSTGALLISLGADPNFPCGTPLPGAGELLISLPWQLGLLAPAPWTTPGVHTSIDVPLPTNNAALGLEFYAQGLLTAPGNTKLTRALKVTVGTD